jgi:cytolysin (calcineurin-like family phosphatase)
VRAVRASLARHERLESCYNWEYTPIWLPENQTESLDAQRPNLGSAVILAPHLCISTVRQRMNGSLPHQPWGTGSNTGRTAAKPTFDSNTGNWAVLAVPARLAHSTQLTHLALNRPLSGCLQIQIPRYKG